MAAPDEILVGPLTWRLTRHEFRYESPGEVSLHRKSGTVAVHRRVQALAEPRPARGLETLGVGSPMIGRDVELARLMTALELAGAGSAQLVRIVGEAGVGKSRLVTE